jgi:acetyl esterase/lipase
MHGGALILGSRTGIMRPFKAGLLEQGYVIVSIGYRLAPETKLPAIIEDVQDAWKWMQEQARRFGIDRAVASPLAEHRRAATWPK